MQDAAAKLSCAQGALGQESLGKLCKTARKEFPVISVKERTVLSMTVLLQLALAALQQCSHLLQVRLGTWVA